MAFDIGASNLLFLDACCLLNLYATTYIERILRALPTKFAVAELVADESLFVLRSGADKAGEEREMVYLRPLIAAKLLRIVSLDARQMPTFVNQAVELEDGEAASCALALHDGGAIATDERKVFRVMRERAPHIQLCTTTEIIRAWAEKEHPSKAILIEILTNVRIRGRFVPGRHDPGRVWWESILGSL